MTDSWNVIDSLQRGLRHRGIYGEVGEGLFHSPQPAIKVERLIAPAQDGVAVPRFALGAHAVHVKQRGIRPVEALHVRRGFRFRHGVGDGLFVSAQALAVGNIRDFNVPDAPKRLDVPRVFLGQRMRGTEKHQLVDSQPLPERSFGSASQLLAQPVGDLCRPPVVAQNLRFSAITSPANGLEVLTLQSPYQIFSVRGKA